MKHRMTITRCSGCGGAIADDDGPGKWSHTDSAPSIFRSVHFAQPMPAFTDSRRAADIVMRCELIHLWGDMEHARSWAYDKTTRWSGQCEGLGRRILRLTHMVGPVDVRNVPMAFLLSMGEHDGAGYRETAEKIGVPVEWMPHEQEIEWRRQVGVELRLPEFADETSTFGIMAW
ncbi:hypothetical protein SEA_ALEEMILY_75 [Gordonia phage Aleemily]|uniref:Uncharacterized protein n=1 Tax=Gordonia phage Aleemily TaxID=2965181 RepID=A0A9E7TXJ9_9CAUD|nr:hypothetical protein SEA_ALEEMILY_75 [Gordonia phage Aleemily]